MPGKQSAVTLSWVGDTRKHGAVKGSQAGDASGCLGAWEAHTCHVTVAARLSSSRRWDCSLALQGGASRLPCRSAGLCSPRCRSGGCGLRAPPVPRSGICIHSLGRSAAPLRLQDCPVLCRSVRLPGVNSDAHRRVRRKLQPFFTREVSWSVRACNGNRKDVTVTHSGERPTRCRV